MGDFAAGGLREPQETDEATANAGYLSQPASLGDAYVNSVIRGSGTQWVMRHAEHGAFAGASDSDRIIRALMDPFPSDQVVQPETVSADEINRRYAAPGTKIATKPMSDDLGRMLGQEQHEDMARDDVISRYENVHSWYSNIPLSIAAFMSDPTNLATSFIPGVGEEMILARLGLEATTGLAGFAARAGARVVAGGTAGLAAQAPVTALKYFTAQAEGSTDYDARAAFADMASAAVGGAAFHAGFGTIGDLLKARFPNRALPAGVPDRPITRSLMFGGPKDIELEDSYLADVAHAVDKFHTELTGEEPPLSVKDLDLEERYFHNIATGADTLANFHGIRTAFAQLLRGEQVDVMPIFDEAEARNAQRVQELDAEIAKRKEQLAQLPSPDPFALRFGERAKEALTGEKVDVSQATAAAGAQRTQLESVIAGMQRERDMIERLRTEGRTETAMRQPIMGPAELAATQKMVFARGITSFGTRRFEPDWAAQRAAKEEIASPTRPTQWPAHLPQPGAPMPEVKGAPAAPAAAEGVKPGEGEKPPGEKPPGEKPPPGGKPGEGEKPAAETAPTLGQGKVPSDAAHDMAMAENLFARMVKEIGLSKLIKPDIEKADAAMSRAQEVGEAYAQAAQCLVESGV